MQSWGGWLEIVRLGGSSLSNNGRMAHCTLKLMTIGEKLSVRRGGFCRICMAVRKQRDRGDDAFLRNGLIDDEEFDITACASRVFTSTFCLVVMMVCFCMAQARF